MWILEESIKKPEVTSLYVKAFMNCLLPEKQDTIDLQESSLKKLQSCVEKIDQNEVKSLRNVEEMFGFVL